MYKCRACGNKIALPDDSETNKKMEAGGSIRLTCQCGQDGCMDIVVALDEGVAYTEAGSPEKGYYVCSWSYPGSDPPDMFRSFIL